MENKNKDNTLQDNSSAELSQALKAKTYSSILKGGRRSNKLKNINPTHSSLREAIGKGSPEAAFKSYRPYLKRKPQTVGKDVFKIAAQLVTKLHQVFLFATNNSNTMSGEDAKSIQKFKIGRGQDWTLNDSIVSISYRQKSSPEEYDMKFIVLDMPAFLHIFCDREGLMLNMRTIADELSASWKETNSSADMAEKRKDNEIPILLDVRKNQYTKNWTELVLAGTTFNHTLLTQNIYKDVDCKPEDVCFQLRYQTSEGKCKKGMVALPLEEWQRLFNSPDFSSFYERLWNYLPLPQEYSTRIEEYVNRIEDQQSAEDTVNVDETTQNQEEKTKGANAWATEWANTPINYRTSLR